MTDPAAQTASDDELRTHVAKVLASQYELDRELGRGGMGIVYAARDRRLKRTVAIKLLPPEFAFRGDIRTRFLREAETAAQLSHPNIVPIYSVDEREGLVYFVMACVDGDNLARIMHDRGPFSPDETRRIIREVADALHYAHGRGVVHRDIKPDNILLDRETGRPMITDFGIARAAESGMKLTATGMAIGTPAYMAPEQAAGDREVDGRTDLYSLGIVAYQMLAGELPFIAASTPAMLVKHISEAPPPIAQRCPSLPPDLARAVMMLLAKEPADRFPSAGALVVALDTRHVPASTPAVGAPGARGTLPPMARGTGGFELGNVDAGLGVRVSTTRATAPQVDDVERWNAPAVVTFRRKLAPYITTAFIFLVMAILPGLPNLLFVTAIWTVVIAFQYAKLWSDGYDWRDVFKQPRDRFLVDVISETVDDSVAMFDPKKREALRERRRAEIAAGGTGSSSGSGLRAIFEADRDAKRLEREANRTGARPPAGGRAAATRDSDAVALAGDFAGQVRQANANRDEILRRYEQLPKVQREGLGADVPATARALASRVQDFALGIADVDRSRAGADAATVEREIDELEAQANPLDPGSDQRVRRLSQLRRQRRALLDLDRRRTQLADKLETCRLALENLRLDLMRLQAGAQGQENITTMAEAARVLARDVDAAMHAGDQLAELGLRRGPGGAAGA